MSVRSKKATKQEAGATGASGRHWGILSPDWNWGTLVKAVFLLALLIWPVIYKSMTSSNYVLSVMTQAGLFAMLTVSVGLVLGQAGQLSFGHTAFYGVGAYVCGMLVFELHVHTLAAWIIGALAAGVVALIVGRPVLKLKYFYLALATMALVQIFLAVVNEWKLVGGTLGFGPVARMNIFGLEIGTPLRKYYMVWVVCILILLFVARLLKYRTGRALRALCVSEIASSTLGVRNSRWKLQAFVYNALICGLAGGLFAFNFGAVSPQSFTFAASVLPIVMMLVGGDRYPYGWILGAIIITWADKGFSQKLLEYNGTVYSVIMILLLLFLPAGILGLRPRMAKRLWAMIKGDTLRETSFAGTLECAAAAEADKETTFCETKMSLPTSESPAATEPAESKKAGEVSGPAPVGVPATEPTVPAQPSRWDWVWCMPLVFTVIAIVLVNVLSFLEPAGTGEALKETKKALASLLVDRGILALAVGLPLIVAAGFSIVRRRWAVLASALVLLAEGVFLTLLLVKSSDVLGIDGELAHGLGLTSGVIAVWLGFLSCAPAFWRQMVDARQEAGPAATAGTTEAGTSLLEQELARRRAETKVEGPLLRIENVSVHFGGLRAVSEVSFDVKEGSITALIGPNGAGKTTLFNAVSRLQRMAGGRIWFGDTEVTEFDPASAARLGMARTFQNLRLFVNMSVLENVLVGCHRHETSGFWAGGLGFPSQKREEKRSRRRALDALALVGLQDRADLPASSLPYGQQRLVEIARALASEPRLLLLDEPAAGTNQSEREELVKHVAAIRDAGITVLLVEHDMDLVMDISDTVNVLDYGKLISSGTPEEVQKDQKVVTAYLGAERGARDLCATRDLVDGESCPVPEDLLVVEGLVTAYGSIEALHGVSLTVPKGMVVTVLGANGAGKSTLLHTISGITRSNRGTIHYQGNDITRLAPDKIVARGICQVPEGRQLFPTLSVEHNLVVGATGRRDRSGLADDIAYVYELFPILGERRKQEAGTLSGGEQQMLAIGRALTGKPSLLLLDEPSMGLAPLAVERIFEALSKLNEQGLTMLMVEQNAEMALSLAHLGVVLQTGNVVLSGTATQLRQDDRVRASYLGGDQG